MQPINVPMPGKTITRKIADILLGRKNSITDLPLDRRSLILSIKYFKNVVYPRGEQ